MPRQARLDVPGALHHIMVRGIDKSNIFRDTQDKARFLERLGQNVQDAKCSFYAWVLMDNHVHILFRSGQSGISAVMRKLLTWYAQYFNRTNFGDVVTYVAKRLTVPTEVANITSCRAKPAYMSPVPST